MGELNPSLPSNHTPVRGQDIWELPNEPKSRCCFTVENVVVFVPPQQTITITSRTIIKFSRFVRESNPLLGKVFLWRLALLLLDFTSLSISLSLSFDRILGAKWISHDKCCPRLGRCFTTKSNESSSRSAFTRETLFFIIGIRNPF